MYIWQLVARHLFTKYPLYDLRVTRQLSNFNIARTIKLPFRLERYITGHHTLRHPYLLFCMVAAIDKWRRAGHKAALDDKLPVLTTDTLRYFYARRGVRPLSFVRGVWEKRLVHLIVIRRS